MLAGFLDWQRSTMLHKCAGLTGVQLATPAVPPSMLSLLGLVRHLTDVERTWFRVRFGGEEVSSRYWREDRPTAAFDDLDPAQAEYDLAALVTEQHEARQAVAGLPLEHIFVSPRWARCHCAGRTAT